MQASDEDFLILCHVLDFAGVLRIALHSQDADTSLC